MTEREAINVLLHHKEAFEISGKTVEAIDMAIAALEKQEADRWIPCSVRPPEDYSDVLVWFEYFRYGSYNRLYQTYGIGNYSAQYDAWTVHHETGWDKLRVIAWKPLPEAYKEEEVTKTKNYTAGYRDCAGCMYELMTTNREYPCSDCREMVGPDYPNRYESKDTANDEP